jgi:hypothetical protein
VVPGLRDTDPRRFVVRAVDRAGRLGEPSAPATAAALPVPRDPVFATSFTSTKADTGQEGVLGGKAVVNGVPDVREGGWITYPHEELLQLSGPLSVELWANIERIEGIPVLMAYGHWDGPGYWLQLIGGTIRWYLPMQNIVDAGVLPTGGWHQLCGTYDGQISRLYVDGKQVGQKDIGMVDLTPWPKELRIGVYSDIDPQFQTLGQLDDVRIWQRALTAEEIQAHFAAGRSK